jgi:hypothetical protein
MNYQEPYRIHQIDLSNIVYTKVKTTETKKLVFIKYQDNKKIKPLVIQCPSLLNINQPTKVSNDYHELEIPLITQEKDKAKLLNKFFEDLDDKIIDDAKYNSTLWFDGIKENKDSIKYKRIMKDSDSFPDGALKIKVIKNIDFETMLQIENKSRINVQDIPVNYWCKMLLEVYALVINHQTNTFSLFLRPIILSFKDKQASKYNYTLLEDSDSDKDEMDVPDSELSSIFMKQVTKRSKDNNLTSSQVKILEEVSSTSSSNSDNDEDLLKSSSSSEKLITEETKPVTEETKSVTQESIPIVQESIPIVQESIPIQELTEPTYNLKEESNTKVEESTISSDEDKIILSDSSDEEKYLEKMRKIL